MELKELNAKVDELAEQRRRRDVLKETLDGEKASFELQTAHLRAELEKARAGIDAAQEEILAALREAGSRSWRTDRATVTRKSAASYVVVDKDQVLSFLKRKRLLAEYTTVELSPRITSLYEQADVPGVDRVEKEYISVLAKK